MPADPGRDDGRLTSTDEEAAEKKRLAGEQSLRYCAHGARGVTRGKASSIVVCCVVSPQPQNVQGDHCSEMYAPPALFQEAGN